jgi:hypothetical protein
MSERLRACFNTCDDFTDESEKFEEIYLIKIIFNLQAYAH